MFARYHVVKQQATCNVHAPQLMSGASWIYSHTLLKLKSARMQSHRLHACTRPSLGIGSRKQLTKQALSKGYPYMPQLIAGNAMVLAPIPLASAKEALKGHPRVSMPYTTAEAFGLFCAATYSKFSKCS